MVTHRRFSKFIPAIFFVADLISFNSAFGIAFFTRFGNLSYLDQGYGVLQVILNLLWFSIFFYSRLYEPRRELSLTEQLNRVFTGLILNLFFVFTLWFAFKPDQYSRGLLFFLYFYFSLYVVLWRSVWYYSIRYYRTRGYNYRNIVVAGYNEITEDLVNYFAVNKGIGYRFLGYFTDRDLKNNVLGSISASQIIDFTAREPVDVIFLYTPLFSKEQVQEVVNYAENNLIKVKLISQISGLGFSNIAISNYGAIPTLNITALPLDLRINRLVKRIFDLVFSGTILLLLLSWMLPLIALIIKMESRGPVFFRQERNGKDNKIFKIYKFRTMKVHNDSNIKQARKNDRRVTKFGAFLRKTSLDEFPQFVNVFLGDMSVIGPRPHALSHNEDFRKQVDRFLQRHAVKPGITGLAQAKGFRGETTTFHSINGRVRLDRFYVKNWSFWLDIKILVLTVFILLRGNENAY